MNTFSTYAKSTGTAVDGPMVPRTAAPCRSCSVQIEIDQQRARAAELAGKDVEACMARGDREGAEKALREMEAQVIARRAARQSGCFFDERGEADRQALGSGN